MTGKISRAARQGVDVLTNIAAPTNNTTKYLCPGYDAEQASDGLYFVASQESKITAMYVNLGTAPSGVQTHAVTVRKNAADTSMTVTVTGTATSGTTEANAVDLSAGDRVSIKSVGSATSAAANMSVALRLVPMVRA